MSSSKDNPKTESTKGDEGLRRNPCDASLQRRKARLAHQQRQLLEQQSLLPLRRSLQGAVGDVGPGVDDAIHCSSVAGGGVQATSGDSLVASEEAPPPLGSAAGAAGVQPLWQNIGLLTGAGPRAVPRRLIVGETFASSVAQIGLTTSTAGSVPPAPADLRDEEASCQNSRSDCCCRELLQPNPSTDGSSGADRGRAVDQERVGCSQDENCRSCDFDANFGRSCTSHNGCDNNGSSSSSSSSNSYSSSYTTAPADMRTIHHSENEAADQSCITTAVDSRGSCTNPVAAGVNALSLDLSSLNLSIASHGATTSASSRSLSRSCLSETDKAVMVTLQQACCATINATAYAEAVSITDIKDLAAIANCIAVFVRRLAAFSRCVGEFTTLPPDVQLEALRQAAFSCIALCSAQAYNPSSGCWECSGSSDGREHLLLPDSIGPALPPTLFEEHRKLASAIRRLHPRDAAATDPCYDDAAVFALLHTIVLLSPECITLLLGAEADGETVAMRLADAQHRYIMLLDRLLQARLSFARSSVLLPMLLRCIDACKLATANIVAVLSTCDHQRVDPLVLELLQPRTERQPAADL